MLNFASKTKGDGSGGRRSAESQRRVENWVKERGALLFRTDVNVQLMVMEVACNDPNCAPIDTVIILTSSSVESDMKEMGLSSMEKDKADKAAVESGKWIRKVPKRTIEVTEEDIELLFIPESLSKEGLEKMNAAEEEHEAARIRADEDKESTLSIAEKKIADDGDSKNDDMVEVVVDDGWLGRRTMMVRRARVPPPREDEPKHRKGGGPTGCPCCDPDMFDLLMTRPPV